MNDESQRLSDGAEDADLEARGDTPADAVNAPQDGAEDGEEVVEGEDVTPEPPELADYAEVATLARSAATPGSLRVAHEIDQRLEDEGYGESSDDEDNGEAAADDGAASGDTLPSH